MSYILPGITDVIRPVIGPVFRQSGATPLPPWTPAELFTASAGFWYDVSAFANVNQTSTITTPVTAFEQNVGAVFDFSTGATPYPRFNLLSYTEDLSNAYWSKANVNLTANATAAPDSTVTADLLVANTSNIEHAFLVNDILPLGTTTGVTLSVYAKAAGYNYALVRSNGLSSNIFISGSFDLINGTAAIYYGSGNAGVTGSVNIVNAGNGWYQCLLTINTWGNVDPRYSVRYDISSTGVPASNSFGGQPFAGNNVSGVYFWGTDFRFVGSTGPSYQPILATTYSWPANPALQSTSGSRPVITARYNRFERTQEINDAYWTKNAATVLTNDTTAPDGTLTAERITETATNDAHGFYRYSFPSIVPADSYRVSIYVKKNTQRYFGINVNNGVTPWAVAVYDLDTDTVTSTQTSAGSTIVPLATGIEDVGSGWKLVWLEVSSSTSISSVFYFFSNSATPTPGSYGNVVYVGNTANSLYVWNADIRDISSVYNISPPQTVVTSTNYSGTGYASPGFYPHGVRFDGSDDFYTVANVGGATTGFFFAAAIRVDAIGEEVLFSDTGTNTGFRVWIDGNSNFNFAAGNGSSYTTVTASPGAFPQNRYVVLAWYDGSDLYIRINDEPANSTPCPSVTAGTSTVTIGRNNGVASGYFNGWIYGGLYAKDLSPIYNRTINGAYNYCQALNLASAALTDPGEVNLTQLPVYAMLAQPSEVNITQLPVYAILNQPSEVNITQLPAYVMLETDEIVLTQAPIYVISIL